MTEFSSLAILHNGSFTLNYKWNVPLKFNIFLRKIQYLLFLKEALTEKCIYILI